MDPIEHYSVIGSANEKYIQLFKPLKDIGNNDFIVMRYDDIIHTRGLISELERPEPQTLVFILNNGESRGLYMGQFRITISTKGVAGGSLASITFATKAEGDLWENIRMIPVLQEYCSF